MRCPVNLQPDHGQSLLAALSDPLAAGLAQKSPVLSGVYSLVKLGALRSENGVASLYDAISFAPGLAATLAAAGLKQLTLTESIAETNLSTFARGGAASLFTGETVLVTDSPAQIERKPDLASASITSELLAALKKGEHDVITAAFANPAVLGRTGNLKATIAAIEAVDKCLGKIAAQIDKRGGTLILLRHLRQGGDDAGSGDRRTLPPHHGIARPLRHDWRPQGRLARTRHARRRCPDASSSLRRGRSGDDDRPFADRGTDR